MNTSILLIPRDQWPDTSSPALEPVRFHIPGMACESDVDLIFKTVACAEKIAKVTVDRETREVEILSSKVTAAAFRTALSGAGFCITR